MGITAWSPPRGVAGCNKIYMVYHWMYIHGIYMVYCGISMDNPSFLKPDFAAGPCCWSHSICTRVWVIKSVLFHAPPWQLCQGKRLPQKAHHLFFPPRQSLSPPPPQLPVLAAVAAVVEAVLASSSFLAAQRSRISCLVKVGADCAGPSGCSRGVYATRDQTFFQGLPWPARRLPALKSQKTN